MYQSLDTAGQDRASHEANGEVAVGDGCDPRGAIPSPKPRVLIVDDEDSILASLRRLLRREPYELVTVNSPQEALRLMETDPFPLVITDYRMPGMTGTELLREVQCRWPQSVRIVLSGYSQVKAIIAAINEGAIYKFITKPWNDEEIKLHIRRALEQFTLEAENRRLTEEIGQQNERLRELNGQLDQRAADASSGQTFAQELLESIDAGVLTIDEMGLIVGANRRAMEYLSEWDGAFIGGDARSVLPEGLHEAILSPAESSGDGLSGRFRRAERTLQWRIGPFVLGQRNRGRVLTLWEEIPCRLA